MQNTDVDEFTDFWSSAWEAVGRNLTARAIEFTFEALNAYTLDEIRKAVALHMQGQKGRNPPTVADVVDIIGSHTGSVNADEAWGAAVSAADETLTVIWTQPMAEAWGVAQPIFNAGDEVGARMAFRAHYERDIAVLRAKGIAPTYWVSQGSDEVQRVSVVQDGIRRGLLPPSVGQVFSLPAPTSGIAGLLESAQSAESNPEQGAASQERLTNAIAAIRRMLEPKSATGPSHAEQERERLEQRKRDTAERLAGFSAGRLGAA